MKLLKTPALLVLVMCSAFAFAISSPKQLKESEKDCKKVFRILGSSFVAGSVLAAAISYLEKDESDRTKNKKRFKSKEMPESAEKRLNHWSSDKELYPVASDVADYILDKYGEDPKFSAKLMSYIDANPEEAISALNVRHGLRDQTPEGAKKLAQELGSQAHYALTFAWIIGAVYNEKEKAPEKYLKAVILSIEKEIDSFDNFIR
ncbi:MAG: hypothetical protein EBR01_05775 [Proteobacteria bacterium]|nr:hypothetical protein [Pseudomonadota bacterium]